MKIGQKIRDIRINERNLSQEYVAGKLELSLKGYANIENGTTDITLTRLEEVAEILEVNPIYIITYKENGSGFLNTFNNGTGNQGTNIMNQGTDVGVIRELYERIIAEKDEVIAELRKRHG